MVSHRMTLNVIIKFCAAQRNWGQMHWDCIVHNKTHKVRNCWVHAGKACWEKAIGSFLSRF